MIRSVPAPRARAAAVTLWALTLLALGAAGPAQAQIGDSSVSDTSPRFPDVTGRSLTGRVMHLPADFEGDLTVAVVAFRRHQQEDVDTWTPQLRALAADHPGLRVYELPTLSSGYRIMRGFIDGGMRRGIPDSTVRAATVTLYIDKRPFKAALQISGEDSIQLFLVERGGRIRWRAAGRYAADRFAQLEAALAPGAAAGKAP
jgi:hypothetical protein